MARSWTTDRLDRGARGALLVSSAVVLAVRVQAVVVHARLMSTGSGSLTAVDVAALAAVGLAALVYAAVVHHRRRARHRHGPRGTRDPLLPPSPAEALLAATVLWAAVHLQWTVVIATRTTRDPWDHDTTPLEDLLLVGLALATVLAVRHRWRGRRRGRAVPRADILRGRLRSGGARRAEGHLRA